MAVQKSIDHHKSKINIIVTNTERFNFFLKIKL